MNPSQVIKKAEISAPIMPIKKKEDMKKSMMRMMCRLLFCLLVLACAAGVIVPIVITRSETALLDQEFVYTGQDSTWTS